ncbi:amino acid adenylation domain-containing protein [Clostridium felsineum]|uniref:non-ribosomal peptide synthetase n=1 Tax=Clostridium felsineum TaxID=36839 RepID=UPI00214DEC2D|nr:non-ribosomal peptide synthetase [Clostridium felsineum]MCR3759922.1 amino acid adenylation domain-containing protein [Clostridium felsineum]
MDKLLEVIFNNIKSEKIDSNVAVQILKSIKNEDKNQQDDIAVIGISLRFPNSNNVDEYWENISNGINCIKPFPNIRKRQAIDFLTLGSLKKRDIEYSKGGHLNNIDKFDYEFFHIPPREAYMMDPNQRLFLEVAYECLEDGGYAGNELSGSKTGVFVGYIGWPAYKQVIGKINPEVEEESIIGNTSSIIASRIAYFLNLRGPSILIDTACSSSLVAVHMACNSIKNGECDQAIAGGIKIHPCPIRGVNNIGIESNSECVKAFDNEADGTVWGEGVAAVLLKPLKKAIKDKDNIYAIIKGGAINNDGRSIGITAPNSVAQKNVIIEAWKNAKIDPKTISYIETHGTGTKIGDPIEIQGIRKAFEEYSEQKQFCAVGSVKSNIGHLDNASGISGLIKAIMALKNKKIPPSLNFNIPNKEALLENSPVYVNDRLTDWEPIGEVRRCGVSSFGFSGTNCHIILEEYISREKIERQSEIKILTLSAQNDKVLKELVYKYLFYLEKYKPDINSICYTANCGRIHLSNRIAIICKDIGDLKKKLNKLYTDDFKDIEEDWFFYGIHKVIVNGRIKISGLEKTNDEIRKLTLKVTQILDNSRENAKNICKFYTEGANVNWQEYYMLKKYRKISLPTYPFQRKSCWLDKLKLEGYERLKYPSEGIIEINSTLKEHNVNDLTKSEKTIKLIGKRIEELSSIEKTIVEVFCQVLGINEFNVYDNLYDMGVESLISMKIVNRLNEKLNIQISIAELLNYKNLLSFSEGLNNVMAKDKNNSKYGDYPRIEEIDESQYYETSSAQKRMFILNKINNGIDYNISSANIVKGQLNFHKLQEAIDKLVERNESLRTTFDVKNNNIIQIVHKTFNIDIEYYMNNSEDVISTINKFIKPFDLIKGPLFRVGIVEIKKDEYILLFDIHHIISDGRSMEIIKKEIVNLYENKEVYERRIQYKDFASWQNKLFDSLVIKEQSVYWKNKFSGDIPVLNLFTDYERPEVKSTEGDVFDFTVSKDVLVKLNKLSSQTGKTKYMILLTVYYTLLYKHTLQEDIVVGSPISGRNHVDVENIVGMFINTLALRSYPKGEKTFTELLEEVKEDTLNSYKNQDYQFEALVENLELKRNLNRNSLFDTMFVLQNPEKEYGYENELSLSEYNIRNKASIFDMTLSGIETNNGMNFIFEYCTKLFKRETIERFSLHYKKILDIILDNPEITLDEIDMLSENEKKQILCEFNQKIHYEVNEATISELFEQQVKKNGNNIALIFEDEEITYKKLNVKANQVARRLRKMKVNRNDKVALLFENSVEMIVAILAVLKSGGAYVPLDSQMPEERINSIIEDSNSKILLTHSVLYNYQTRIPKLNLDDDKLYFGEENNLEKVTSPEDLAYIIYTSGTTGKPKGVMIQHKAILNTILWRKKEYNLSEKDVVLQLFSYCFDGFLTSFFTPITSGCKVVILSSEKTKDVSYIKRSIGKYKVTNFICVPTLYSAIIDNLNGKEAKWLKIITLAGEKVNRRILKKSKEINDKIEIYNEYGPTECSVAASVAKNLSSDKKITIGKPISNTNIYILDEKNNLLPIGTVGEICISGKGISKGYLNNKELTKNKFIRNPYKEFNGEVISENIIYKTGDIGRYLPDGNIEYIGRNDEQIKIRGFRIEIGEIEKVMLRDHDISTCIVIAKTNNLGNKYLVAYYTSKEEKTVSSIREYLSLSLPEYMIPNIYVYMKEFKFNRNGKVDKKSLPEPDMLRPNLGVEFKQAETKIEKELVNIWKEILDFKDVGVEDNFFDLGGNSMLVISMQAKIEDLYPDKLKVTDIFANPTISKLSKFLGEDNEMFVEKVKIKPIEISDEYFISKNEVNENKVFRFNVEGELFENINRFSKEKNIEINSILIGAYILLFNEVLDIDNVVIHIAERENLRQIEAAISEFENLADFIKYVDSEVKNDANKYIMNTIEKVALLKNNKLVLPAIAEGKKLISRVLGLYDLLITFSVNFEQINFNFKYNADRISSKKAEELIDSYANLIEILMDNLEEVL